MKFFFLIIILILSSCSLSKQAYVCGDRPCVDKKEFNEYFAKSLSIEVLLDERKRKKNTDLVKLNTNSSIPKKTEKKTTKQEEKLRKKTEKKRLKEERVRLIEERKIKKKLEKLKAKEEKSQGKKRKQASKTSIFNDSNDKKMTNNNVKNQKQVKSSVDKLSNQKKSTSNKKISNDTIKSKNAKSICDDITDCDIDIIAEMLIKKGKKKPFPNIASN